MPDSQPSHDSDPESISSPQPSGPCSGAELYALLEQAQIFATSIASRLLPLVELLKGAPPQQLAKALVEQRALTPWQAEELLAGRTSVFLPGYKLLQPLPAPISERRFVAEQISRQRLVLLQVAGLHQPLEAGTGSVHHPRLIHRLGMEWDEVAQCRVEAYTDAQRLAQLLEHANFNRGHAFEVASQLFSAFCQQDSLVLDWQHVTLSNVMVNRHGEVLLHALALPLRFSTVIFDHFVIFLDEVLQSQRPAADEILTVLAESCWHAGHDTPEITSRKLSQQARPLLECITRPEVSLSLDYLRMFVRKSPRPEQVQPENCLSWKDLLPPLERKRSEEFLVDHPHPHEPPPAPQKKTHMRKGLPVKVSIVLCALILNGLSYLHSHHRIVTPLGAGEHPTLQEMDNDQEHDSHQENPEHAESANTTGEWSQQFLD